MKGLKLAYYAGGGGLLLIIALFGFLFTNRAETPTTSIDITQESLTLSISDTEQLTYLEDVLEGTTSTWATSDEQVASISDTGLVTAIGEGVAVITLTNDTASDYVIVFVNGEQTTYTVDITDVSVSLAVDGTYQLAFTQTVEDESLTTFTSNNEDVATVTDGGFVTAVSEGLAVVTMQNGDAKDYVVVEVANEPLTYAVDITETSQVLDIDTTYQLNATVDVPEGSSSVWASSNNQVATVSDTGLVTAIAAGSAVITLTNGSATDYMLIQVTEEVLTYSVDITEASQNLGIGDTYQLNTTLDIPEGSQTVWASSNESVATISNDGVVTAHTSGTAVITLTVDQVTDYVLITVDGVEMVEVIYIDMLNDTSVVTFIEVGSQLTYPTDPTFAEHTFEGWVTSINDLDSLVADGSVVNDTLFLYAYYTSDFTYTAVFNTNGGDAILAPFVGHIGDTFTLESAGEKIGFEFGYWKYNFSVDQNLNLTFETAEVGDEITLTGDMVFLASFTYVIMADAYEYNLEYSSFDNEYGLVITGMNDTGAFDVYTNSSDRQSITLPTTFDGYQIVGVESLFSDDVYYFDDVVIPEGYLFVGDEAFLESQMNNLYLPASLQTIGDAAFEDGTVNQIHFAANSQLTTIESDAFNNTSGFTSIEFPKSLMIINSDAFYSTDLETVTFEEGASLFYISYAAFSESPISSFEFVDSLKIIEEEAFAYTYLQSVDLPDSVQFLGDQAFYNSYLESITVSENSKLELIGRDVVNGSTFGYTNDMIILGNQFLVDYDQNATDQDVVIPEGVTLIANYTFENIQLNSIAFPSTLVSIGDSAFYFAAIQQSQNITLPNSLTYIYSRAFYATVFGDDSSITLGSNLENMGSYVFYGSQGLFEVTFADSVHSDLLRNAYRMAYQSEIKTVTVGEGYTDIANDFINGSAVEVLNLPSTITLIWSGAFNTDTLTEVNVNGSLNLEVFSSSYNEYSRVFNLNSPYVTNQDHTDGTYIFENVLYYYSLSDQAFSVPTGVNYIAGGAVPNTQASYDISGALIVDPEAFLNVPLNQLVTTSINTQISYASFAKPYYSYYTSQTVVYDFVGQPFTTSPYYADAEGNYIYDDSAYYYIENYKNNNTITPDSNGFMIVGNYLIGFEAPVGFDGVVTIPEGIVYIDGFAFYDKGITEVHFPSTLVYIASNAFRQNSLTSVTFNEGLTVIGNAAFQDNQITTINFSSTLTRLDQNVFVGNAIDTLVIPSTIKYLDYASFGNNPLSNVTFEDASEMNYIWDPFDELNGQDGFYIVDGVLLDVDVFDYYDDLGELVIPEGVTVIASNAIRGDVYSKITLPQTLERIMDFAFEDAVIGTLVFNSSPTIDNEAFDYAYVGEVVNPPLGFETTIFDFYYYY